MLRRPDARLEGYGRSVVLHEGGGMGLWVMVFVMAALCIGVLFKNPNRSYQD